jgi:ABC-type uncharacterized transport system substrate-binding protein
MERRLIDLSLRLATQGQVAGPVMGRPDGCLPICTVPPSSRALRARCRGAYGYDREHLAKRAAAHIDRILKGAKPADLPVEQASKFELVINLKTAKALGLTIPPSLLLRADQVIE